MKGFKDKNKKFHPITQSKGVRKSRVQKEKTLGVRLKKDEPFKVQQTESLTQKELVGMQRADIGRRALDMGMSEKEMEEWEHVAGSEIVKVKHEMLNGKPITSIRFANGEEWFEFDNMNHQEEFIEMNEIEIDHEKTGEFIEIDHPLIAGYVTMSTGRIAFGEREDRKKRTQTVFPYKNDSVKLSKLKFKELPDQLQDDISDFFFPSGVMVFKNPEKDWDVMTQKEKEEFLAGIKDE